MENVIRIPRPLGVTQLLNEYSKIEDPSDKEKALNKVRDLLLNHWFLNNGSICGNFYSLNSLSIFLGVDISYIQDYIKDKVINNKIWNPENQDSILKGMVGQQLSWAMEERMIIGHQLDILSKSQGNKYTPFVSAEVNKTIKLLLESSTSFQSLFRLLTGGNSNITNVFTQINQQNNQVNNVVSYDEVLNIIEESNKKDTDGKLLGDNNMNAKFIEDHYNIDDLPKVVASEQQGVDTSKEGLNISKNELNLIADNYKGAIEVSDTEFSEIQEEIDKRFHHEHRRQEELGEDLDADDPECSIYDEPI